MMKIPSQRFLLSVFMLLLVPMELGSTANADGLKRVVETSFRNAIVKVDVSSKTPVIKDGKNLCISEGTGFLISSTFVATAAHVFAVDSGCGELTIVLKSRRNSISRVAKLIETSADDVALLNVEEPFQKPMCFITLTSDVFNTDGFRIGIPSGLQDPVPKEVVIGLSDEEWKPLVLLTPTPVENGESGGPILVDFNVVGLMKAKHLQFSGYSFMIKGSALRSLMLKNQVALDGEMCNPVVIRMIGNSATVRADSDLSQDDQATVLTQIQKIVLEQATAIQNQVKIIQDGSSVSISGLPQTIMRQSCINLPLGRQWCSTRPEVVYNPVAANAAANLVAAEIKDRASAELWKSLKN